MTRDKIEDVFNENLLSCFVDDQVVWDMDTLDQNLNDDETKKEATLYLNQPKWPRKTPSIPNMSVVYSSSALVGGTQTYQIPNIPSTLQRATIMKYEKLDATNPSPIPLNFDEEIAIEKIGTCKLNLDTDTQTLTVTIGSLAAKGDIYFSIRFYDEFELFIGESNIFQLTVFSTTRNEPPVLDHFNPVVYDDNQYYLIALCTQPDTYPLKQIQFSDINDNRLSVSKLGKEVALYMNAKQASTIPLSSVRCNQLDSNDNIITSVKLNGELKTVLRPIDVKLTMSSNRDSYDCDFQFVSSETSTAPACHLNGLVDTIPYHSETEAAQSSNSWSCRFYDQFTFLKKHELTCSVLVSGLSPVNSTSISNEADESSVSTEPIDLGF